MNLLVDLSTPARPAHPVPLTDGDIAAALTSARPAARRASSTWRPRSGARHALRFARQSPAGVAAVGLIALIIVAALRAADRALRSAAELVRRGAPAAERRAPVRDRPPGARHPQPDHPRRRGSRCLSRWSSVLLGDSLGFAWGVASGYLGRPIRPREPAHRSRCCCRSRADPGDAAAGRPRGRVCRRSSSRSRSRASPARPAIIRSVVLSLRELAYVEAARALGAPTCGSWRGTSRRSASRRSWCWSSQHSAARSSTEAALSSSGSASRRRPRAGATCSAASWPRRSGRRGGWWCSRLAIC